jgi:DNA-binding NarL/FixJ family response regulator
MVFHGTRELPMPVRVLVADDHTRVLERVRNLLSAEFIVVTAVLDALIDASRHQRPDVVVADLAIWSRIGKTRLDIPLVILSVHREPDVVQIALDAGVRGYVHKLFAGEDLALAIRSVLAGKRFVSSSCALPEPVGV